MNIFLNSFTSSVLKILMQNQAQSKKKEEKEGENKQNLNPACFKLTVPGSPSSSSSSKSYD
ncbi:hypothetical protein DERF_011985 [Dermatophagoides farinae]|uniref:Uncharacterized protein n=1 Tax=Dermatophagoides farinae TaxID=6954 RepID=A0A922HR01_DERFA|nr:hypothetical protein DERF_011985 [Dermatophagoides farinae]